MIDAPEATSSTIMFSSSDMGMKPKMHFESRKDENDNEFNVLILDDVAVFRSGSFEDSMGRRNTWEQQHMDSMAAHFDMLRERNILADIPVRSGHPGWLVAGQEGNGKVVGWHTGIRVEERESTHDGSSYHYLIASYEIIDEEAQKAVSSGLWRNRSSEIGTYITNDGAEYFPVYMGFAYVDIPAVEGLNGFSKAKHIIQEDSMTDTKDAAKHAAPVAPTPPAPPVAPAVPEEREPASAHAAPAPAAHVFRVAGAEVSDFAAVQAHIDSLEAFQSETAAAARLDFVNGLVSDGKILASQKESMESFASGLSAEQFDAWKATYSNAPANPILARQPEADPNFSAQVPPHDAVADEISVLKGTVGQHKLANIPDEKIKNTTSYKRLLELDPTYKL